MGVGQYCHGEVFLRKEGQFGAHTLGAAVVADHPQAVRGDANVPADAIAAARLLPGFKRPGLRARALHGIYGGAREDRSLIGQAVLEVEHGEADEIVGACVDGRGRRTIRFAGGNWCHGGGVFDCQAGFETRPAVHNGVLHAQGREQFLPHEIRVTAAGHPGDRPAEQAVAQVGVLEALPRRRYQLGVAVEGLLGRWRPAVLAVVEVPGVEGQARSVAGHPAHRGLRRLPDARLDRCHAEHVVDRGVEIDQPPLHQQHQRRGGHRLGDGGQGVGCVGGGGNIALPVGQTDRLLPDDAAALRHRQGQGGYLPVDYQLHHVFANTGEQIRLCCRCGALPPAGGKQQRETRQGGNQFFADRFSPREGCRNGRLSVKSTPAASRRSGVCSG